MKSIKKIIAVVLVAVMGIGVADAGLRFGVKLGTNVNHLSADMSVFNKNNRAGFTGGVMMEYIAPVIGLGFDLGLQYAYMNSSTLTTVNNAEENISKNRNFIQIPLNLKYKFSLPLVGKFLAPYLFTGPSFDFKLDKNTIDAMKTKTFQTVWNIGLGLEFARHLQIGASYGFGMNSIAEKIIDSVPVKYHNNYWTITAAYLF
ncbi:MAG: PorT family protein [Muribaculaceae bacterium]|nr:PorT family protein [Muribaculaceae bacterium]